jgi:single-stranded DNA-binding protein
MSLEIKGRLHVKYETMNVSDKFKKREFVLELSEEINGNTYTQFAKMQLVQNKCEILDKYNVGDMVKVSFNINGTKWEKDGKVNYITNLSAWRIEMDNGAQSAPAQSSNTASAPSTPAYNNPANNYTAPANNDSNSADDLPF